MDANTRTYIAIDLKSFYASVECVARERDALDTFLAVADESRTDKTICLAVSPALKSFGISGRARLFEAKQVIARVNAQRAAVAPGGKLSGTTDSLRALQADSTLGIEPIIATPRMARYMRVSADIYRVYLKYVAPEDIHVYSIDEVFIDATDYLRLYGKTAHRLAMDMIRDVLDTTGITATAGIGTNLYLAKVAMDIVAKRMPADADGVRIAELDEMGYRRELWAHEPITDFWRVGRGYARRLKKHGIRTMGDVARLSLTDEELLYKEFGINAELLIDHAWGWEPCTMVDIKAYRPGSTSSGIGQVLMEPYTFEKARVVLREMTDALVLDLVAKGLATNHVGLFVGYDVSSKVDEGRLVADWYGRPVAKPAGGVAALPGYTSSAREIVEAMLGIFDREVDRELFVRRINVVADNLVPADSAEAAAQGTPVQLDLFGEYEAREEQDAQRRRVLQKEQTLQQTILDVKAKFGKNAVLRGTSFEEGATGRDRNRQIGGHKA